MLEEMSALVRRVDGLEEKLRLRVGGCEELVRQRTRELEQQVHTLQQKALLASSTSEEMSKRHTTRLRKLGQAMEEHSQRLASVEDATRRPVPALEGAHFEARFVQLERQLLGHEDELRSLSQSAEAARSGEVAASAMLGAELRQGGGGAARGGEEESFDSMLRALEREVSALAQRASAQLDEHAAALANLRVRSDGQEQRLAAASERLGTAVNPPLEALRAEVAQLREHDRLETKTQLEHLGRSVQAALDSADDSAGELRSRIAELRAELQAPRPEDHPAIHKLTESSSTQEQAIRRLEAMLMDVPRHGAGPMSEELCGVLVRLDSMEHRLECVEQAGGDEELAEKADRAEVTRIDAALQELSEPLRRLSQRTASNENRTVALERRVEQVQQIQGTVSTSLQPPVHDRLEDLSAAAAVPSMDAIADLTARVVELESLMEHGRSLDGSVAALPAQPDSDGAAVHALRSHVSELGEQLAELRRHAHDLPSSSGDQADHGSETLHRLASTEEGIRVLQQQLHQLQGDHRSIEHAAACGAGHDERIVFLEKAIREVQQTVQELCRSHRELAAEAGEQAPQRLAALESGAEALRRELQELCRSQRELVAEAGDQAPQRLAALETGAEALRQELQELQGDLQELRARPQPDAGGHEQRLAGLEAGARSLQEDVQELRRQGRELSHGQALSADHEDRFQGLEREWKAIKERAAGLEGSVDGLGPQLRELREESRELQAVVERLNGDRAAPVDEGLGERLAEVARRVETGEGRLAEVQRQLEEPLQALREELRQLSEGHAELERRHKDHGDLGDRVDDALQRITSNEKAVNLMQEQHEEKLRKARSELEEPLQAIQGRMEELAKSQAELERKREGKGGGLADRMADAVRRVDGREEEQRAVKELQQQQEEQLRKAVNDVREQQEEELRKAVKMLQEQQEEQRRAVQSELDEPMRTFRERLDKLSEGQSEIERRHTGDADLADRVDDAIQRIVGSEKAVRELQERREERRGEAASPELAESVAELSRRVAAGEEGAGVLRADLRVAEASLKDVLAQLERLATQVEAAEAAAAARPTAGAEAPAARSGPGPAAEELEARVRELQRQVSAELESLARHQEELRRPGQGPGEERAAGALQGPAAGQEVEATIAELGRQVASELRDLQEHQQDLRSVKDLVASLSKKAPTAEQDAAAGASSLPDAECKAVSKLEATVEDLCKQVGSAVLAGEKGVEATIELQRQLQEMRVSGDPAQGEATESLKQQVQKLQSDHDQLTSNRIRTLETRMDQLRGEQEELARTRLLGGDFVERVSDVMQRLKGGEEKIVAVEKQLEQPIKALDTRLEQLRSDYEALKQTKVLHSDLTGRISDLVQRLTSSEEAIAALQKRAVLAGPQEAMDGSTGGASSPTVAMEARILELQRQVTEELHCLERHQGDFAMAAVPRRDALPAAGGGEEVEKAVAELSKQVTAELRDLREHQQDLGRVRTAVMALSSRTASQQPLTNGHAPAASGEGEGQKRPPQELELQVEELSKQVSAELQALTGQQAELGRTKATLGDLAQKVKECDTTCVSLRQQLDECRGNGAAASHSSPVVGLGSKSSGSAVGITKASAKHAASGSAGPRRRGASAEADSEQSDTYGNEFDESIGEESISESR